LPAQLVHGLGGVGVCVRASSDGHLVQRHGRRRRGRRPCLPPRRPRPRRRRGRPGRAARAGAGGPGGTPEASPPQRRHRHLADGIADTTSAAAVAERQAGRGSRPGLGRELGEAGLDAGDVLALEAGVDLRMMPPRSMRYEVGMRAGLRRSASLPLGSWASASDRASRRDFKKPDGVLPVLVDGDGQDRLTPLARMGRPWRRGVGAPPCRGAHHEAQRSSSTTCPAGRAPDRRSGRRSR
jgi:hypothetical protein